jgi:putative ABC transport system permease protein
MRAVIAKVAGELRGRRVQTAVVGLVVLLASGTGALALTLQAAAGRSFDSAFAAQRGAHLAVSFDRRVVAVDQLAATPAHLGAAASGGPWPTGGIAIRAGTAKRHLNLQGRADPGGAVERLRLVAGRWVTGPGEIVVTRSLAARHRIGLGDRLVDLNLAARPALRVVGEVVDVDEGEAGLASQSAWVLPTQVAPLTGRSGRLGYRMAYRLPATPTQADLDRAVARLTALLPPGAVHDSMSYLQVRKLYNAANSVALTILLAFAVVALGAAAAITATMVSGAVVAGYRDVATVKALGFTPTQVVGALVGQLLAPALAGGVLGIPLGTALAQPLLQHSARALGLAPEVAISPTIGLLALAATLVVVAAAAALPAVRAARLRPARVIALGAAPGPARRTWPGRLQRLGLPRPLTLGAGDAFARPVRDGLTAATVLIGVATLTFAVGLHGSLDRFRAGVAASAQVAVERTAAYPDARVMADLAAQPETAGVVATSQTRVLVHGVATPVLGRAYRGDPASVGVPLAEGRWFTASGEAVAPSALLRQAHLRVGDSLTATIEGRAVRLRIVGSNFDPNDFGRDLSFGWSTYAAALPGARPFAYLVRLRPGTDPAGYARRIQAAAPDFLSAEVTTGAFSFLRVFDLVAALLVVVLAALAVAGVFTSILLTTLERARDTAILRALGMTPGQVLAMAVTSACTLGLSGAVLGVPAGIGAHREVMALIGVLLGNRMPASALDVYAPLALPSLIVAGLLLAAAGALPPARWAARAPTAEPLRAE